jgi:hypothetical protein
MLRRAGAERDLTAEKTSTKARDRGMSDRKSPIATGHRQSASINIIHIAPAQHAIASSHPAVTRPTRAREHRTEATSAIGTEALVFETNANNPASSANNAASASNSATSPLTTTTQSTTGRPAPTTTVPRTRPDPRVALGPPLATKSTPLPPSIQKPLHGPKIMTRTANPHMITIAGHRRPTQNGPVPLTAILSMLTIRVSGKGTGPMTIIGHPSRSSWRPENGYLATRSARLSTKIVRGSLHPHGDLPPRGGLTTITLTIPTTHTFPTTPKPTLIKRGIVASKTRTRSSGTRTHITITSETTGTLCGMCKQTRHFQQPNFVQSQTAHHPTSTDHETFSLVLLSAHSLSLSHAVAHSKASPNGIITPANTPTKWLEAGSAWSRTSQVAHAAFTPVHIS